VLESFLLWHEYVHDVSVAGRLDERGGEVPVAFVQFSESGKPVPPSTVESALKFRGREHKSQCKWLTDVCIVDQVPRLPCGQALHRGLKKMVNLSTYHGQRPDASLSTLVSFFPLWFKSPFTREATA